jgi:hypothetical protein
MGPRQVKDKLVEYIKSDKEQKVKEILLKHRGLLNAFINQNNDLTPSMCCAYYNSDKSLNVMIELLANFQLKEPKLGNSLIHIAAFRNNLKVLKEIIGKGLIDTSNLNAYEMNCLDLAVVNRAYITSYYLVHSENMSLKSEEEYKKYVQLLGLSNFKIKQFLYHIENKTRFEQTPSFLFNTNDTENKIEQNNFIFPELNKGVIIMKLNVNLDEFSNIKSNNYIDNSVKEKLDNSDGSNLRGRHSNNSSLEFKDILKIDN